MKTEEEATGCWCPFVRYQTGEEDCAGNRWLDLSNPGTARCIASQCMAWRWTPAAQMGLSRDGFCGLAGNPDMTSNMPAVQEMGKS